MAAVVPAITALLTVFSTTVSLARGFSGSKLPQAPLKDPTFKGADTEMQEAARRKGRQVFAGGDTIVGNPVGAERTSGSSTLVGG
jgi:hypothetical protein